MNHPNKKFHHTIKGVLLIGIVFMAIFPFLFITETISDLTEPEMISKTVIQPSVELPKHDVFIPNFIEIKDIKQRKAQFFNFLKPAIDAENVKLAELRTTIVNIQQGFSDTQELTTTQMQTVSELVKRYKVKVNKTEHQLKELLLKVDQIPRELVLVQAANESAWGTSRFARIGLNFFGMWCFKQHCGLIPRGRDSGLKHEVAVFDSVEQMVTHYFHNINTNVAYDLFRNIRLQLRDNNLQLTPSILATGLLPYSERGMDYIVEINTMLKHNRTFIKT